MGAVVGSDVERYVRALALVGAIRPLPWGSARGLAANDLNAFLDDSTNHRAHPWQRAMSQALSGRLTAGMSAIATYNTGFPWGSNDGAMWQGAGANAAVGTSVSLRWGPVSAVAAPVLFTTQNASFPMLTPPTYATQPLADPLFPTKVDRPQRMGARHYGRLNAGESSIQLDAHVVRLGASTASVGWGVGEAFPAILGPNAGGFPHLFVSTPARGLRIPGVGRIAATYLFGMLSQTAWSPVQGSEHYVSVDEPGTKRISSGLSVSFLPSLLPGFELGASRFYHSPYRFRSANRWKEWSKPFEGLLKNGFNNRSDAPGDQNGDIDNQLASFFTRVVFPSRGVEATFEWLREDHSWDSRDLAGEPENNAAYLGSIRAVTHRSATHLSVLTLEHFDGDVRPIAQVRPQGFLYVHGSLLQGHTERGQLLGSPIGVGAVVGSRTAWEQFSPSGSIRINLQRLRTRSVSTPNVEGLYPSPNAPIPNNHDWILDGSVEATRFRGRRALTVEGGLAWAGTWNYTSSRFNIYSRASISLF